MTTKTGCHQSSSLTCCMLDILKYIVGLRTWHWYHYDSGTMLGAGALDGTKQTWVQTLLTTMVRREK